MLLNNQVFPSKLFLQIIQNLPMQNYHCDVNQFLYALQNAVNVCVMISIYTRIEKNSTWSWL